MENMLLVSGFKKKSRKKIKKNADVNKKRMIE